MSDGLSLRPAREADLPDLHALIESAYRGESARAGWTHEADLIDGDRTSVPELRALIDHPDERLLIAEMNGVVMGSVHLSRLPPASTYLGLLTVDPRRQASGLGKRIMTEAERAAATDFGATHIEMTVIASRAELIAYYERRGYRLTGEERPFPVPLDPPLTFVVMRKAVAG
jgi:predicted N-acetyltransferase YhbS